MRTRTHAQARAASRQRRAGLRRSGAERGLLAIRAPGSLARSDGGSRVAELQRLQQSGGNGAVQRLLSQQSPEPVAAPAAAIAGREGAAHMDAPAAKDAPGGAAAIKQLESRAAGVTTMDPGQIPSFDLQAAVQDKSGTWSAGVQATSSTPPAIESYFPGQGLHDLGTVNAGGCKEFLWVTPELSDLIRQGEQEHIDDYLWAYRLSYLAAAATIAQIRAQEGSGGGPATGSTAAEAQAQERAKVRAALPAKLRPPDADFQGHWMKTFGKLCGATYERDNLGWHRLSRSFILDAKALKKLPLPADGCTEVTEYQKGGRIGVVGSEQKVREKYDSLPDN